MIYFFGDVHGNFKHVISSVLEKRPKAIVLLGDIEAQQPYEQDGDAGYPAILPRCHRWQPIDRVCGG